VIKSATGKAKAGRDIFRDEIRQLFKHLLLRQSRGQEIEDINHSNPHSPNARPPPALLRIHGNTIDKFGHDRRLPTGSLASTSA